MVGPYLQREEESGQHAPPPSVGSSQCEVDAPHHKRSVDQCPHLGDVTCTDNQDKVGRQPIGHGGKNRHTLLDAHHEQHGPHGAHGEEEKSGRGIDHTHHTPDAQLDPLCRILHIDQIGGHAAEHRPNPLGVFAIGVARLVDFVTGALVLFHIVLG